MNRRFVWIVVGLVAALLGGVWWFTRERYVSSALIRVVRPLKVDGIAADVQRGMQSEAETQRLIAQCREWCGGELTVSQLKRNLRIQLDEPSSGIRISFTAPDARMAQRVTALVVSDIMTCEDPGEIAKMPCARRTAGSPLTMGIVESSLREASADVEQLSAAGATEQELKAARQRVEQLRKARDGVLKREAAEEARRKQTGYLEVAEPASEVVKRGWW